MNRGTTPEAHFKINKDHFGTESAGYWKVKEKVSLKTCIGVFSAQWQTGETCRQVYSGLQPHRIPELDKQKKMDELMDVLKLWKRTSCPLKKVYFVV